MKTVKVVFFFTSGLRKNVRFCALSRVGMALRPSSTGRRCFQGRAWRGADKDGAGAWAAARASVVFIDKTVSD
jgi:hypothetical protein